MNADAGIEDGDMFRAIRKGRASVVTDTITTFTEEGIDLASGEHLAADDGVAAAIFHHDVLPQ